jgi:flavorubredoxin
MNKTKLPDNIFMVSANIDHMLFESMWDVPHGVSLNSYIVKGEKTAIIDGIIGWDGLPESLYAHLKEFDITPESIDYLVINHIEPDHSGWIENFKKITNDFTVVMTKKAEAMLYSFYGETPMDTMIVKEGDSLDLGKGKKLTFHPIPNIHWPETMMTFEEDSKMLFPCDMYGAFGTIKDTMFDDQFTKEDRVFYEKESIRYYSNVMATFSKMTKKAIEKTRELNPFVIAPGHGPVYRENPSTIIDAYARYAEYASGKGKNEVTILWGSMYGMTGKAVEKIKTMIEAKGITVNDVRMPQTTSSEMVTNVFKSAGVIVAAPTYEYKMFPPVAHAIDELGRKKISGKKAFRTGSYGWSGGAEKDFNKIIENVKMKWDFLESVEFEGSPNEEAIKSIEHSVNTLCETMQENIIE